MKLKIKYLVPIVTIGSLAAIAYGFYIQAEQPVAANKYIGFGTAGLFLVAMPLFLIIFSKDRNLKNYMLTEENIKKMRGSEEKKPDNQ